ncbi:hypothetical protein [Sphingomonas sp. KR3-1]|uniref:hypothetical protein n=1 Tax=Sphingomonas sp. KR3-1 TaxID=3156611 RepID=UPI0032B3332E
MIQAAIAAALAGASPLPLDGATAMADDFARLCLSQANGFSGTGALARTSGWSSDNVDALMLEAPAMRGTIFVSPGASDRILTVGFKTRYIEDANTACAISRAGAEFIETVAAVTGQMGREPNKLQDGIAVWMPQARGTRLVAVSKSVGGVQGAMGVIAIDMLEEKTAP